MQINPQQIQIKIDRYGAIEKLLPEDITFNLQSPVLVNTVLEQLKQRYPDSSTMLDHCACAVEDDIVSRQEDLTTHCTLVLLSPVAGG